MKIKVSLDVSSSFATHFLSLSLSRLLQSFLCPWTSIGWEGNLPKNWKGVETSSSGTEELGKDTDKMRNLEMSHSCARQSPSVGADAPIDVAPSCQPFHSQSINSVSNQVSCRQAKEVGEGGEGEFSLNEKMRWRQRKGERERVSESLEYCLLFFSVKHESLTHISCACLTFCLYTCSF